MVFTLAAIVLSLVGIAFLIWAIFLFAEKENGTAGITGFIGLVFIVGGTWFQTHRIVPVNHVGVSRSTFSQDLQGLHEPGIASKPFFGSMYQYPASTRYEKCEQYTPAIKGSYGIVLDLCFYYNTGQVDWLEEIYSTGSLNAGSIMGVWRNSIVGDVARSIKKYTPEALSDNRAEVERAIFENVSPWFDERGVPLTGISFKNWDFASAEVAKAFDESIVSQRRITEQTALYEAAKISRDRETFEAETARLVAERQKEALNTLGLSGQAAVDYLWIKLLGEQGKAPDVLILNGTSNVPVSIPLPTPKQTQPVE